MDITKALSSKHNSSATLGVFCFVGLTIASRHYLNFTSRRNFSSGQDAQSNGETKKFKKSAVYTRTGDKGTSSLYNGERRPKNDLIFHALGNQDELNAAIGIAREYCLMSNNGLENKLVEIQSRLFDLGAAVATPVNNSSDEKIKYTHFPNDHTKKLENWIDELDSYCPPIRFFILPSGGLSASHLHLARTICRRAERSVVSLVDDGLADAETAKYLNRLSDFLFVASRYATYKENRTETKWEKNPVA